jgi:uncharacterized protein
VNYQERPVVFDCEGDSLLGIVTQPITPCSRGVLVIVGGPQYRVGSHRQFVLLGRKLAEEGYAALRFDYRGMGDSSGTPRSFDAIDADIRAAVDCFVRSCPRLTEIVLWGLCDGASAALIYAHQDERVRGVILLNPWVRTDETLARTHVKHYYGRRLLERQFWAKLAAGSMDIKLALRSFAATAQKALSRPSSSPSPSTTFQDRMLDGLNRFRGNALLVLSGRDLTAKEFVDYTREEERWRKALESHSIARAIFSEADHTFSSSAWRQGVEDTTIRWLKSW